MSEKLTVPGVSSAITVPADIAIPGVHQQIVDFLDGRSNGAELMLALYSDFADEELPPRLAALVRYWRSC
jgi:hypothetical protein